MAHILQVCHCHLESALRCPVANSHKCAGLVLTRKDEYELNRSLIEVNQRNIDNLGEHPLSQNRVDSFGGNVIELELSKDICK